MYHQKLIENNCLLQMDSSIQINHWNLCTRVHVCRTRWGRKGSSCFFLMCNHKTGPEHIHIKNKINLWIKTKIPGIKRWRPKFESQFYWFDLTWQCPKCCSILGVTITMFPRHVIAIKNPLTNFIKDSALEWLILSWHGRFALLKTKNKPKQQTIRFYFNRILWNRKTLHCWTFGHFRMKFTRSSVNLNDEMLLFGRRRLM